MIPWFRTAASVWRRSAADDPVAGRPTRHAFTIRFRFEERCDKGASKDAPLARLEAALRQERHVPTALANFFHSKERAR